MLIGDWDLPMVQLIYSGFRDPHADGPENNFEVLPILNTKNSRNLLS
jgi:hypothetical protein